MSDVPTDAALETEFNHDRWPTGPEFMSDDTGPDAISFAASEILSVLEHANQAAIKCSKSKLPIGTKMAFVKRMRRAIDDLYLGVPNQQKEVVAALVVTELFGSPEAVETLGEPPATSPEYVSEK